jgi:hypothetical protein
MSNGDRLAVGDRVKVAAETFGNVTEIDTGMVAVAVDVVAGADTRQVWTVPRAEVIRLADEGPPSLVEVLQLD